MYSFCRSSSRIKSSSASQRASRSMSECRRRTTSKWGLVPAGCPRPAHPPKTAATLATMPTALTLPNIDISPFLGERTPSSLLARQATAAQVHDACTRYGFFYLSGIESVVSQEEMDEALSVAREFFGRPEEEKAKLRIKKGDGARGASAAHVPV